MTIGVLLDRLRESSAGASVTAWLVLTGVTVGALRIMIIGILIAP